MCVQVDLVECGQCYQQQGGVDDGGLYVVFVGFQVCIDGGCYVWLVEQVGGQYGVEQGGVDGVFVGKVVVVQYQDGIVKVGMQVCEDVFECEIVQYVVGQYQQQVGDLGLVLFVDYVLQQQCVYGQYVDGVMQMCIVEYQFGQG